MSLDFPLVIAHRGGLAFAPENSISAFKNAVEMGCKAIECDVMLTSCSTPIIYHDESLRRLSQGKGKVSENTWEEIKALEIGRSFSKKFLGEKILLLEQALEFFIDNDVVVNIEMKPTKSDREVLVSQLLSSLMQHWPMDKPMPLISSFDYKSLELAQTIAPEIPRALLIDKKPEDWQPLVENLNCYSLNISNKLATEAFIQEIKSNGYKVFVFTVNQRKRAKQLFDWGVDSVFSDYPNLMEKKRLFAF